MLHGMKQVISDHLHRFCILKHDVLFLDHSLHKILMDHFPEAPPYLSILHDEKMVTTSNEIV